jgi:hypothetical protein
MTSKYAVAVANLFDNVLTISFVEAATWQDAVKSATGDWDWSEMVYEGTSQDDTLEAWKEYAFNGDTLIDVKELPQ